MPPTPGAMLRFALRGFFFRQKKLSKNQIMRIYEKKYIYVRIGDSDPTRGNRQYNRQCNRQHNRQYIMAYFINLMYKYVILIMHAALNACMRN